MKKLLLSILLIVGLTSFSAKVNRQKPTNRGDYETKKVKSTKVKTTTEKDIKKETINKTNTKISGPKYRVEGSISTLPIYNTTTKKFGYYAYKSVSFLPEWKKQINPKFDITFGPKISLMTEYHTDIT
ncbi:hypothetical protein [Streptobacillus ratti]|uniref:hypothetical protein n=1 Tax=Streptobacillus ratti TaxID=1720557 RepID=UPI001FCA4465|nr:hypothetical protein [Streptobacillus ratti]